MYKLIVDNNEAVGKLDELLNCDLLKCFDEKRSDLIKQELRHIEEYYGYLEMYVGEHTLVLMGVRK